MPSTDLYLRIRRRMIEGMRIFVNYTNKWKNKRDEEKTSIISKTTPMSLSEIIATPDFKKNSVTVKDKSGGKQYKPSLPVPATTKATTKYIRYSKLISEIDTVSQYLFGDSTL